MCTPFGFPSFFFAFAFNANHLTAEHHEVRYYDGFLICRRRWTETKHTESAERNREKILPFNRNVKTQEPRVNAIIDFQSGRLNSIRKCVHKLYTMFNVKHGCLSQCQFTDNYNEIKCLRLNGAYPERFSPDRFIASTSSHFFRSLVHSFIWFAFIGRRMWVSETCMRTDDLLQERSEKVAEKKTM